MSGRKVKLAWMMNENSKTMSLKKRRLGLVKKVEELTILCDLKACLIIFSPNEVEPMVWPSVEAARDLVVEFLALPAIEKKKKETNLESYLKEKTKKVKEQLKSYEKNTDQHVIDQLMTELHHGRRNADDLTLSEIDKLICFSWNKIMICRKRLGFVQHPPLRDPPMHLFESQFKELRTTTNDDERARRVDEAVKRINIDTIRGNQSHYLMDQWFFASPEQPQPRIHQQIGMEMVDYNENQNPRSYLPYRGSNSNGNPNVEMEPSGPQEITFHDLFEPVSQQSQYHNMNNNPIIDLIQPSQYLLEFMRPELGVIEEPSNINNGDPQFHINTTNDGLRQEPPTNETTVEEGNDDDATWSLDINRDLN